MRGLFKWFGLMDADGRRAWAFFAMLLGCGIMTGFAALALLLVRRDAAYTFWLGIAAHVQIFVALSGFTAMFIKRDYDIETKVGSVKIKDKGNVEFTHEQIGGTDRVRVSASADCGAGVHDADEERGDQQAGRDSGDAVSDDRDPAR
jgi:hypothetical protein